MRDKSIIVVRKECGSIASGGCWGLAEMVWCHKASLCPDLIVFHLAPYLEKHQSEQRPPCQNRLSVGRGYGPGSAKYNDGFWQLL
jgi:hypothetical protein